MVEENVSILGLPTLQVNFIHHVIPRDKSAILQWCTVTVSTFTTVKTMAECLGYLAIILWLSMLVSTVVAATWSLTQNKLAHMNKVTNLCLPYVVTLTVGKG
jgi:hypothetical protein